MTLLSLKEHTDILSLTKNSGTYDALKELKRHISVLFESGTLFETLQLSLRSSIVASTEILNPIYTVGSSTTPIEYPSEIEEQFYYLFHQAQNEDFEDGFESQFSKQFVALVKRYGTLAIEIVADLILQKRVNNHVAIEALHYLGQIDDDLTREQRRWLLVRSLNSDIPKIRDGALIGIAYMDDPRDIPYIERAIERESIPQLRIDLKQVLKQLQDTLQEQGK